MKKFQFRLQRVLDAKESEEKQAQRELGQAQQALIEAENELTALEGELKVHAEQQRLLQSGSPTVAQLRLHDNWKSALERKIKDQTKRVQKAREEVETKRARLLELTKEKKVLEKLKEKQSEEFKREMLNAEQDVLDDIGTKKRKQYGEDDQQA